MFIDDVLLKAHSYGLEASAFYGLAAFTGLLLSAALITRTTLPRSLSTPKNTVIYTWLAFDALIHSIFEGAFIYTSTFGRTAQSGTGWQAGLWREYAKADARWGVSDTTIVSLELLTVFICGPLCLYICYLIKNRKESARHFWTVVLSTMELYGGFLTFGPDWLAGSPNLNTSNFLYLWVYLFFMNMIWVVIPLYLLYDSYHSIAAMPTVRISPSSPIKGSKKKR